MKRELIQFIQTGKRGNEYELQTMILTAERSESTSDIIFTEKDAEDSSYNLIALTKGVTG